MFIPYLIEEEYEYERSPWTVWSLCLVYVIAYLVIFKYYSDFQQQNLCYDFGCVPVDYRWWSPLTCTFLHADILHLLGNVYFLWIYGKTVEKSLGAIRFLIIYLIGAFVSVTAHVWTVSPFFRDEPTIGASGAISAVLGAFLVLFPTLKIRFLIFSPMSFRPLATHAPAYFVLGSWFFLQLADSLQLLGENTQVAFWAHAAGFAAGAAVGSIYIWLHHLQIKWEERRLLKALAEAAAEHAAGNIVESPLDDFPESELRELEERGFIAVDLLKAELDDGSENAEENFYQAYLQAKKDRNNGRLVAAYYVLVTRYRPERFTSDQHESAACAAMAIKADQLALYAFFQAVNGRSGYCQGFDRLLVVILGIMRRNHDETRASKIIDLLQKYFPYSEYTKSAVGANP